MKTMQYIVSVPEGDDADLLLAKIQSDGLQGVEQQAEQMLIYWDADQADHEMLLDVLKDYPFSAELLEAQNWNATWESNFQPIRITDQVGIRADFHPPFQDCLYDLVITPKMSFGTGHHETTHMMVTWLDEMDLQNQSVFDFGCGTGVLAILAAKKGASKVIGIDNDFWSIENARENVLRNEVPQVQIDAEDITQISGPFDLILANINLNVLLTHMKDLYHLLKSGAGLILSGILLSDESTMQEALKAHGFSIRDQKSRGQWLSLYVIKL
jgi:ribosomal protein L11 methyltransferase